MTASTLPLRSEWFKLSSSINDLNNEWCTLKVKAGITKDNILNRSNKKSLNSSQKSLDQFEYHLSQAREGKSVSYSDLSKFRKMITPPKTQQSACALGGCNVEFYSSSGGSYGGAMGGGDLVGGYSSTSMATPK